ncbi:MAG TPA: alkyl sulfatase dimerization domain-containing protein [Gammaproteobacteria bacterium]|nr:alkyl sulfatase dimerization domain-containing protein [Gammaproteobacteria bacterium]
MLQPSARAAITFVLISMLGASPISSLAQRTDDTPEPPVGVATEATRAAQEAVGQRLLLTDDGDLKNATRGLVAQIQEERILNPDGSVAWDTSWYDFLKQDAPPTANPSLWRQCQLNALHGLFEVTDGIWQFRGYDLAVMTLIKGNSGWIVVDPLTSPAVAAAGLKLANRYLGERPVSAVIYTHSHVDHFGGVRGIASEEDLAKRGVQVIAPHGFMTEVISENVFAGPAMYRRVMFHLGSHLPFDPKGQIGAGLGQRTAVGTVGLLAPTREISPDGESMMIDGVPFEFLDAANTEAPAELAFYLPKHRALCTSEVVTRNFHNVLTPRGAKVRDSLHWSRVIDDMLRAYGDRAEVLFASHHWPTWGKENVQRMLRHHRNLYRYIHDQTLRRANHGQTMHEIAEDLAEPPFAATDFSVRDYYGTTNHNAKAVYQYYFGWWDGVPANYHRLPPEQQSKRYVEFMGGADVALLKAIGAFEAGDYRWAATVLNDLVFADPENAKARSWLAAAYEQMGFQAESGIWRNIYLTAAMELRRGASRDSQGLSSQNLAMVQALPTALLFDSLAVRFNPARFKHEPIVLQFLFPDRNEAMSVDITDAVAFPRPGRNPKAGTTVRLSRSSLDQIVVGQASLQDLMAKQAVKIVDGDRASIEAYFAALDRFSRDFNIVTP